MKHLVRALFAVSILAAATITHAATINVFSEYIGTTSYSSPSQARQDAYAAFLTAGIDFGFF